MKRIGRPLGMDVDFEAIRAIGDQWWLGALQKNSRSGPMCGSQFCEFGSQRAMLATEPERFHDQRKTGVVAGEHGHQKISHPGTRAAQFAEDLVVTGVPRATKGRKLKKLLGA